MKKLKIDYNAPVVLTFALISLVSLILGYITGGISTSLIFTLYRSPSIMTLLRMFTYTLGHADITHFMGNMTLFLVVGPMLEEKYGSKTLLLYIMITAFVSAIIFLIFCPNQGLVGASGIVFMMILLSSVTSVKNGQLPLTMILVAIVYIGAQILDGVFIRDNVSQLCHIAGGVCGCVLGMTKPFMKKK